MSYFRTGWFLLALLAVLTACVGSGHAARRKAKICLQPQQSGRCFGYVPSFAYNPFERRCEEFIYGGCGGNDNRFQTKTECERQCRDI